jgi:hypothetical protein
MVIAEQTAMPVVRPRRLHQARLQLAPSPRPAWSLAKIGGLIALVSFIAALAAGVAGIALVMLAASLGG